MTSYVSTPAIFVGSYTHALDAKRRMIFPSTWRNMLGEPNRLYAFPHNDEKCLFIYPEVEMTRRLNMVRNSRSMDAQDQQAVRSLTAGADMLVWDAQGRIRVGDNLLAHAEVKEQVVLVGTLTRIELWSVENFDLALPQASAAAEDMFFGGY